MIPRIHATLKSLLLEIWGVENFCSALLEKILFRINMHSIDLTYSTGAVVSAIHMNNGAKARRLPQATLLLVVLFF
jgi:hypothetical protein